MNIFPDWLYQKRHSSTVAVEYEGVSWTYQELFLRASNMAGMLRAKGIQSGDRVAIVARHGLVFTAALHALMQLNAILVPINTKLSVREIAWQLEDSEACLIIADLNHAEICKQAVSQCKDESTLHIQIMSGDHWDDKGEPVYRTHVDLSQVHAIVYTSGTTGYPKGAMITYGNHFYGAVGSALRLGMTAEDKWLIPMPLFHVGGLSVLMRSVIYGTSVLIHDTFDPEKLWKDICGKHVTLLSVVAVMLQRLLDYLGENFFPEHLRTVLLGGGPAPQVLLKACIRKKIPVQLSYGLTEANSQVATIKLAESSKKIGSAGQSLLMNEIVISENGAILPSNVPGEILLRGPTVFKGYYNNSDATDRAIQSGWLHTGDIGYLDEEGYLYVLDRRNDLIISGGENVYPAEIEAVLQAHEDVQEAGVARKYDATYGQVPAAVVCLRPGAEITEIELIQYCETRLAKYKVPKIIRFAKALPRNASGKLLRRELGQWLS